jgi:multisubunit Na+/H+ antiporter MnhG subunit
MSRERVSVTVGALLLLLGTVLVFRAFDSHSHSASDTLRPFLITMAPVWALSIAAARVLLHGRR